MKFYQQGDVLLKESETPKDAVVVDTEVLHKGTNHQHTLKGNFKILDLNGKRYVEANSDVVLVHEEHGPISLSGVFELSFVKEYDHFLEESRVVND